MTPLSFFDAANSANLPPVTHAMAGYVDGAFRSLGPMRLRFPEALWLSIATSPSSDAMVLDVERGDATPGSAAAWVIRQLRAGVRRPALYVALSNLPGVLAALALQGLHRSDVRVWTAHWTGVPHVCGPACGLGTDERPGATQYETSERSGFDTSLTTLEWFDAVRASFLSRGSR